VELTRLKKRLGNKTWIMTRETEGGIQSMCNLGEGLIEKHLDISLKFVYNSIK